MRRVKELLKRAFFLPPLPTALIALPSLILVFTLLNMEGVPAPLRYFSYLFSAYGTAVLVTGARGVAAALGNRFAGLWITRRARDVPVIKRYMEDTRFRTQVSLITGLTMNNAYVVIRLTMGIISRSMWPVILAAYYMFLSGLRYSLVRHMRHGEDSPAAEFRRYRSVGITLLLMHQVLSSICLYIVAFGESFSYPGPFIYAMALYTFYAVISAIAHLIKRRADDSPVVSASRVVQLTSALVSMLSLETAMISRFGDESDTLFRAIMTAVTGSTVIAAVTGMAIFMIVRATRELKKLR